MTTPTEGLSDKAVAVFAFAAYHQLESGQKVSSVVQRDAAGHKADDQAIAELEARGLVRADGQSVQFTQEGEAALDRLIAALRQAVSG